MTTTTMEVATLHYKTMREIGEGKIKAIKRPRKTGRPAKVLRITVVPEVWAVALTLAGGDVKRIQILSNEQVLVHNRSDWNKAKR